MLAFSAATPPAVKSAAPQANRIFAHAKRLRDLGAGPASQRQKHGARPVRLAAITRTGQGQKGRRVSIARGATEDFPADAMHLANRRRQTTAKNLSVG